jgi:starch synthase
MIQPIKILFAVAEAFPLVKTGGLGDVAGSLPLALRDLGVDVRMLLPCYGDIRAAVGPLSQGPDLGELLPGFRAQLLHGRMPGSGIPLDLVDCPALFERHGSPYQNASGIDWTDNHIRFALFSRAAALIGIAGQLVKWQPDVVHANDWHTGLVPHFLKKWEMPRPKSVLTVHNLAYQGVFPLSAGKDLGFAPEDMAQPSTTHSSLEFWGQLSFLKAGLMDADAVTTVSPTYAREITLPKDGAGLDGVLRHRGERVSGIANGIDDNVWNPATDSLIRRKFTTETLPERAENRAELRRLFGLPAETSRPVIGIVSRLVAQKGVDILLAALPNLMREKFDYVVLGTGDREIERGLLAAAERYPDRVAVRIQYDEALAHQIVAGSDILLVPSRFEPCGLTQMYAQRYGCIPLAHKVGGLADTVHDGQDGLTFSTLTARHLTAAVIRAGVLLEDRATWTAMQKRAMAKDLGWKLCAQRYYDFYRALMDQPA